jgi:methionyl-tRNA synthetase
MATVVCNVRMQALHRLQSPYFVGIRGIAGRRVAKKLRSPSVRSPVSASAKREIPEKFTVTTPLYYVNAAPHMGSAYPTIAADVISRFYRLNGSDVTFVTGTDEHGEKIELAATSRGMSPLEHCDALAQEYKALWSKMDIEYDSFVRTTSPKHEKLVQTVLNRVWDNGDIYKANYKGWYCVGCEEYKDDADMDEDHNCSIHRKPCLEREEENYFFRLSRYQDQIEALIENTPGFVAPSSRRNEVLGWVKDGLRDFSISRASVPWGIPISKDPSQTVYVWFDALNGYLSALYADEELELAEGASPSDLQERGWPAAVHIIGKDILRFHAVYWPGMLLSAGLDLPKQVFGHGFLTKDGLKMGKSLGNVLDPVALVDAYGADAVRYYFMREVPFGQDGDFSEERFRNIVNANLANDVGNLLNRTLNLLKKNCDSMLPYSPVDLPEDHVLREAVRTQVPVVTQNFQDMKFHEACTAALVISGKGNQFMEEVAPWTGLKKGTDKEKEAAKEALVAVVEAVRIVAVLLAPVTPTLSQKIHQQLGLEWGAIQWEAGSAWGGGNMGKGHAVSSKPSPVFVRMEGDFITE